MTATHAYTAIVDAPGTPNSKGYSVGRADAGTVGYTPVPLAGTFDSYDDAKAKAATLNESIGVSPEDACMLVLGTMRCGVSK